MNRSVDLLNFGGDTDTGIVREHNEDRLLLLPDIGVFAIVDGMGGERAGEKAAEIAVAVLKSNFLHPRPSASVPELIRQVQRAIIDANNRIYEMAQANEEWRGMACVLTLVLVRGENVVVGHVGDSRLYRLNRAKIEKLTKDHSPVGMMEDAQEITELQAMRDSRRNEVFRDVGSQPCREDDYRFADVFETRLEPDSALLLCSDGLTDMVTSGKIHETVLLHAGDPVQASRELVRIANEAGGRDNVSAIVIEGAQFKASSAPAPLPAGDAMGRLLRPFASRPAVFLYGVLLGIGLLFYIQVSSLVPSSVPDGNSPRIFSVSSRAGSFATIAEALSAARPGDRVEVDPGEYREAVLLPDGVTLLSRIPHEAVIIPAGNGNGPVVAITAEGAQAAAISGFRIQSGEGGMDMGVFLKDADVVITDLEIGGSSTAGIHIAGNTRGLIRGNTVNSGDGAALAVRGSNAVRIELNWLGHGAHVAPAIDIAAESSAHIERNIIEGTDGAPVRAPATVLTEILKANYLLTDVPRRNPGASPAQ